MSTFDAQRRRGIGGSDAPILLGVSPFGRTLADVWREKVGIDAGPDEPTAPMLRGRRLEPIAAEEFTAKTGRHISEGERFFVHPERPYLIGHVDGLIPTETGGALPAVLEIKVPSIQTYLRYRREGLADYIQIQLQHYLGVTGAAAGTMWIWNPELWQGFAVDVQREQAVIDLIFDRAAEFWGYVERREIPPETAPATTLPDLPKHKGEIVKVDHHLWTDAARNLRMAGALKAEAETIYEEAKSRIIALMGELGATAAEGDGLRVYYHDQKGRKSFDKAACLTALQDARYVLSLAGRLTTDNTLRMQIDKILNQGAAEKDFQRAGAPFRSFRSYVVKTNQIEWEG